MADPSGVRGWLTVASAVAFIVSLAVWLFSSGVVADVSIFVAVATGALVTILSVVSAIVEHQPGCILLGVAWAGAGVLLTMVLFGWAYLGESWTYLRGETTTAQVVTCEEDGDDCESEWTVDGQRHRDEVELALTEEPGDRITVRARGDEAVQQSGLTMLVVASSGVAVLSPFLLVGTVLWTRKHQRDQRMARHQPSGEPGSDTSSS
jgi:hypothetical protein